MKIKIKEIFGEELLDGELIRRQLQNLPQIINKKIIIDYSECVMEYDATGVITDYIFDRFSVAKSTPELIIIYDLDYPEEYLLSFLFSETKFLGEDTAHISNEKRKELLNKKLGECNGKVIIRIQDSSTKNVIRDYIYGI